jgi:hypothetical protein
MSGHPEYIYRVDNMLWQAYAELEYNADSIPEQIQAKDAYNAVMDTGVNPFDRTRRKVNFRSKGFTPTIFHPHRGTE